METYNLILRDKKGNTIGGEVVRGHPEIGRKINLQSGAHIGLHGQYRIFDIEDVFAPNGGGDLESITYAYAKEIINPYEHLKEESISARVDIEKLKQYAEFLKNRLELTQKKYSSYPPEVQKSKREVVDAYTSALSELHFSFPGLLKPKS